MHSFYFLIKGKRYSGCWNDLFRFG